MKQRLAYISATITVTIALVLSIAPAARSSFFTDGIICGEQSTTQHYYLLTTYLLFSEPINDQELQIGSCPYENYYAKTYAIELWLIALLFIGIGIKKHRKTSKV